VTWWPSDTCRLGPTRLQPSPIGQPDQNRIQRARLETGTPAEVVAVVPGPRLPQELLQHVKCLPGYRWWSWHTVTLHMLRDLLQSLASSATAPVASRETGKPLLSSSPFPFEAYGTATDKADLMKRAAAYREPTRPRPASSTS
jgi:hypothetical protein